MGFATRLIAGTAATLVAGTVAASAGAYLMFRDQVATITLPTMPSVLADTAAADAANPSGAVGAPAGLPGQLGGTNIVLLGSDSRTSAGDAADSSDARADTTMLVHLSADNTWAHAVSIPRDLVVNLPTSSEACGADMPARDRINVAYTYGGPSCTAAAVSSLTGLPVDHVAAVDFTGFASIVDAAGGYTVCLTEPVDDVDAELSLPAGVSHVDGAETLGLVRMRKTVGNGSDIDRTARQRWVMTDFMRQLAANGTLTNPAAAWRLAGAVSANVDVDAGLTNPATLTSLMATAARLSTDAVTSSTYPWRPNPNDPDNTVVEDRVAAGGLLSALRTDQRPGTAGATAGNTPPVAGNTGAAPGGGAATEPVPAPDTGPAPFCSTPQ